jgi:nitrite reductase (NADH) small subunit
MARTVRVAAIGELAPGTGKELVAEGRVIALFRVGDEFFALDGVCPHAGGPLGKGRLDGCVVTCPWHGWQFDVRTGTHCLTAHIRHASFPVTIAGEDVLVELP